MIDGPGGASRTTNRTKRRIAICGSAPSSIKLAPVGQPEWEIWGCSPGCAQHLGYDAAKVHTWFEVHDFDLSRADIDADYIKFMAAIKGPVYTIEPVAALPNSIAYPFDEMRAKFVTSTVGHSFFASTVSYMLAMAIDAAPDEIGFWGIDMAASSEYFAQKPGCHYFIQIAESRGIKVSAAPQSDLLQPIPPYGFGEVTAISMKLRARYDEMKGRRDAAEAERQRHIVAANELAMKVGFFDGALDDCQYVLNTWVQR